MITIVKNKILEHIKKEIKNLEDTKSEFSIEEFYDNIYLPELNLIKGQYSILSENNSTDKEDKIKEKILLDTIKKELNKIFHFNENEKKLIQKVHTS